MDQITMDLDPRSMPRVEQQSHPSWQRRKSEILGRDNWTCQRCKSTEATLTVHHKSYVWDASLRLFNLLWDYPDGDLITLCIDCHNQETARLKNLETVVYFSIRESCEDAEAMQAVVDLFVTLKQRMGRRVNHLDINRILIEVIEEGLC